jgi:hypothetical protein
MGAVSATMTGSVRTPPSPPGPGGPGLPSLGAAAVAIFGASLGMGCTVESPVGWNEPVVRRVARIPPTLRDQLDLLFVVDDTAGMARVQEELGELWQRIRNHLRYAEGGFPAVRIGVVSTDLGAGLDDLVPGCTATGRGAELQLRADGTRWLEVDRADPESADDEVAAMLRLGEAGCAFEQPLEAMRRALLEEEANLGFVRPAAALGVVFIAGEDDCSVADGEFFGLAATDKFRCFRQGVRCEGDDGHVIGPQVGCAPNPSAGELVQVEALVAALHALKGDPHAVGIGGVLGDPQAVEIVQRGDRLAVAPACAAPPSGAELYPAVRLGGFAKAARGAIADLCATTIPDAGTPAALGLRRALGHRCLEGFIADVDPDAAGRQIDCDVYALAPGADRVLLPRCPDPLRIYDAPGPCWAAKTGAAQCGDFPTQLALQVNWGGAQPTTTPPGTVTEVWCVVDEDPGLD